MVRTQRYSKKENMKHIEKLIKDYEELKDTPNINIIAYLADNFIAMEYKQTECEHSEHLGI